MRIDRIEPGPGQESVWDYPRPPALEDTRRHLKVMYADTVIAEAVRSLAVKETSHPPTYYFDPARIAKGVLVPSDKVTVCEYKGAAHYYHVVVGDRIAENAAWYYPSPKAPYERMANWVAFYAEKLDRCTVDGEVVDPQRGSFYGGWITSDIVGPFKGGPGTLGW